MEPEGDTNRPDDEYLDSSENAMDIDEFETLQNAERHARNSACDFNHHNPTSQMHFDSSQNAADHARVPYADNPSSPSPPLCHEEEPLIESPEVAALCEAMQFAYENNLTSDYLLNSFSISNLFGRLAQSTIPVTNHDGFTDNSHLSTLEIPNPILTDKISTLTITPSSLKLIAEARYVLTEEEAQEVTEQVCRPIKTTPIKFELPILRTDNDRDLKAFQKHMMHNNSAHTLLESIKKHRLPLYPQNIDEGEGMKLSSKVRAESQARMKKADEERLSGTQASMTYLYSHTRDEYTAKDQMAYMIGEIKVEQTPKPEKITPPASPKLVKIHSRSVQAAFNTGDIPIPSDDSSSLLSENFQTIEDMMLGDHQDVWSANTSPIREMLDDTFNKSPRDPLLDHQWQTLEDMKVDVPMMPNEAPQQVGLPAPLSFSSFINIVVDVKLDPEFEKAVLHDIPDDELKEQLEEAAGNAMMAIEQEQLQAIDAVGRVPIPVLDFSVPEPEWRRLGNNEKNVFMWIQAGREQLFKAPSWPVNRNAGSKMIWSPFAPDAGMVSVDENLSGGPHLLEQFLNMPPENEIPTSQDYVHYKKKPAVFEEEDADEDIEAQLKKPVVDLLDVGRKRLTDTNAGGTPKRPRHKLKQSSLSRRVEGNGPALLPGDSPGASGNLLANFMEMHAPKRKIVAHSKYFDAQPAEAPSISSQTETLAKQIDVHARVQPKPGVKAPCPVIDPPATALHIFISIRIHRRMIRVLEGLIPDLRMLERNYDAHNTFTWQPGSVVRTEVTPPLADDADITVSPSTGVIVTSMIRVRQKPRAGTNKGMIQIQVEKASLRYERLIVLVGGEGGRDDNLEVMSASDSTALLELQGFASGLECSVQVHYVGGGDKTLAKWVASCICRYSLDDPYILASLLEPETLWEVFLRRAGFNVFAAQTVASQFKPHNGENNAAPSAQNGLGAFVTMTRDERMRRFGQLVGPKVLERVSVAIDELWNQV